jgi:hypothetical protein
MIVAGFGCALLVAVMALVVRPWEQSPPPSRLRPSGATGLLGAPLPSGAKLIDSRTSGGTSGENYSISASEYDILAFFEKEMVTQGWEREEESDTRSSRSFKKGGSELVVIANSDGTTFWLSAP